MAYLPSIHILLLTIAKWCSPRWQLNDLKGYSGHENMNYSIKYNTFYWLKSICWINFFTLIGIKRIFHCEDLIVLFQTKILSLTLKKLPMALLFLLINLNFLENVLLRNVHIIVIFIIGSRREYVLELVGLKNKTDNALFLL